MRDECDRDERADRDTRHDEHRRRSREDIGGRAPTYRSLLTIAAWIWIVQCVLFIAAAIFNVIRVNLADHQAGQVLGYSAYYAVLAIAFGRAGIQIIKSRAEDVIGTAQLSVALSLFFFGLTIWATIKIEIRGMIFFFAVGIMFLISGIFAIRCRASYLKWKAFCDADKGRNHSEPAGGTGKMRTQGVDERIP